MDIGGVLREARERRSLTLQQVSDVTKIAPSLLDDIEHNKFDRLPGAIFTRGYLRAYASAVGVTAEPLVQEYVRDTSPLETQASPAGRPIGTSRPIRPLQPWEPESGTPFARMLQSAWPALVTAAAIVVVLGGGYLVLTARRAAQEVEATGEPAASVAGAHAASPTAVATPASAGTTGTTGSAGTTGLAGTMRATTAWPATLEMSFSGRCWVSVTADGTSVVYRLVQAGEHVTATATQEMIVRVGDPTTLSYTLNGVPGRAVGRPGSPVTFRINRDTYLNLLRDDAAPTGA